jgi:thiosulfate dehydrogenase
MNTRSPSSRLLPGLLAGMMFSALLLSQPAAAANAELGQAVAQGKELFSHETFGGNGKVCESCHLGGGKEAGRLPNGKAIPSLANAAAIFPRFQQRTGKVITLTDQIRSCATNALEGTPPDYGSDKLNALASYITSLAQGKPLDMGGTPQ